MIDILWSLSRRIPLLKNRLQPLNRVPCAAAGADVTVFAGVLPYSGCHSYQESSMNRINSALISIREYRTRYSTRTQS